MLSVKYDVYFRKIAARSKYHEEQELLHEFNGSDHKSIAFEYDSPRDARNAAQALVVYVRHNKMPLRIMARMDHVVAERTTNEEH